MKSPTTLMMCTILVLALSPRGHAGPAAMPPEEPIDTESKVAQACRLSPYKEQCMAQFGVDKDNDNINQRDLAVKALRHASQAAVETTVFMKEQQEKPDLPPMVQQYLHDCTDRYLDAVEQLDDSMAGLLSNAYEDVQTWINVAITDANSCESRFRSQPGSDELKARNDRFLLVCENAKSAAKAVESSGS